MSQYAIPPAFVEAAVLAAGERGRDFDREPLTVEEQADVATLWRCGFDAHETGGHLARVPVRPAAARAVGGAG